MIKEHVSIDISEHNNGYHITGYDGITGLFDEVHEERIEALKVLHKWVLNQIDMEYKMRFGGL